LIPRTCRKKALEVTKSLGLRTTLRSRRRGRIGGRTSDARRRKRRKESLGTLACRGQKPVERWKTGHLCVIGKVIVLRKMEALELATPVKLILKSTSKTLSCALAVGM